MRPGVTVALLIGAALLCPQRAPAAGYPAPRPLALGAGGRVLPVSGEPRGWDDELWVGQAGALRQVTFGADGSPALGTSIPLPAGVVPAAFVRHNGYDFVLDAPGRQVLAYPLKRDRAGAVEPQRLAVGTGPAGMTGGSISPTRSYVAVANAGSGDLSVYTFDPRAARPALSAERRVAVGPDPVALEQWTGSLLAVAGGSAGTVTFLDAANNFARVSELQLGGVASGFARADLGGPSGPIGDPIPDLVVADSSGPRVRVLFGTGDGFGAPHVLQLPDAASTADQVTVARLDADAYPDVIVGDRSRRTVVVFPGQGKETFGPPRTIRTDVDPALLVPWDTGGDALVDLVVADASRNELSVMLTPGDPQVVPFAPTWHLSADAGVLAWSQHTDTPGSQLGLRRGGIVTYLPVRSAKPMAPRVGRLAPGRPVIAYIACREGRCLPYAWDLDAGHEHRLAVSAPHGCRVDDVAVWDATIAFDVRSAGRACGRRSRGLWLRSGHARASRRADGWLSDLRSGYVAWTAGGPLDSYLLRLAAVGGRARTLETVSFDSRSTYTPMISGRYAVTHGFDIEDLTSWLSRQRLDGRGGCQVADLAPHLPLYDPYEPDPQIAVDGAAIYYPFTSDAPGLARGIFQVATDTIRWRRCAG